MRLVREAEASRTPFVRLADRYSLVFLPLTLLLAGLAWLLSGQPVRALAVLVVATPCPLILAAPVAFIAGISRAAHRGIIVKGGAVIEGLARARTLLLDKTGTLTTGVPTVARVETFDSFPPEELLRLAASLDQVSPHVLAAAIVAAEGQANVFVAVDGRPAGALILADPIREDSASTLSRIRGLGIERLVMVTGDHPAVAERIGRELAIARRSRARSSRRRSTWR